MDWQEWQDTKKQIYDFIIENRSMYRDDGVNVGLGDIIDFLNATVTKTGRKITVDAHGWGGWPMFDHIVDDDWAETGLAEGTIINTYTGTRIWSTWQGACTGAVNGDTIGICPGTYVENVSWTGKTLHIIGVGGSGAYDDEDYWPIVVRGVAGVDSPTIQSGAGASLSTIRGIFITGVSAQDADDNADGLVDYGLIDFARSGGFALIEHCGFGAYYKQVCIDTLNGLSNDVHIHDCYFGLQSGASKSYGIQAHAANHEKGKVTGCRFDGGVAIRLGEDWVVTGNSFRSSSVECSQYTSDCLIAANEFQGGKIYLVNSGSAGVTIHDNIWNNTSVTSCIDLSAYSSYYVDIEGNHFNMGTQDGVYAVVGHATATYGCNIKNNYLETGKFSDNQDSARMYDGNFPTNRANFQSGNMVAYHGGSGEMLHRGPYEFGIDGKGNAIPGIYFRLNNANNKRQVCWEAFDCRFGDTIVSVVAGASGDLTATATNYLEVNSAGTVSVNVVGFTAGSIPLAQFSTNANTVVSNFAPKGAVLYHCLTAGGSTPAPNDAQYVVLAADSDLTVERVFAPGAGLTATDDGAGGDYHLIHATDATAIPNAHHNAVTIGADGEHSLATQVLSGVDAAAAQKGHIQLTGELGGTAASPTVAATHSGSTHHTRAHTLASADDHTGTADRVIYVDHAGAVKEIALGTDGQVLTSTGAATAPAFEDAPAGTSVATDTIWAAAGDLVVGTGVDTAGILAKGDDGKVLTMVAGAVAWAAATGGGAMATDPLWDTAGDLAVGTGADTGAKLALTVPGAANLLNVLGVATGESTPTYKVLFDGTAPEPIGTAAAGTGVVAAHRNHVHALPAAQNDRVIACFINPNPASTTLAKFITPPIPFAFTFVKVDLKAPDSEKNNSLDNLDVIVDVHLQTAANADTHTSTTIFATQGNRPLISYLPSGTGHIQGSTTTFDTAGGAAGDRLYIYCDQTASLTGLHVNITIRPTP